MEQWRELRQATYLKRAAGLVAAEFFILQAHLATGGPKDTAAAAGRCAGLVYSMQANLGRPECPSRVALDNCRVAADEIGLMLRTLDNPERRRDMTEALLLLAEARLRLNLALDA